MSTADILDNVISVLGERGTVRMDRVNRYRLWTYTVGSPPKKQQSIVRLYVLL